MSAFFDVIGFGGMPDDLKTWSGWIGQVVIFVNRPSIQWVFLVVGVSLFLISIDSIVNKILPTLKTTLRKVAPSRKRKLLEVDIPKTDIRGEVTGIILSSKSDSDFPNFKIATYILMAVRLVHHGPKIVNIIDWSLDVQFGDAQPIAAIKVPISESMEIEKRTPNIFETTTIKPEPIDQKTFALKLNAPIFGWILFELPTSSGIPDPRGARLRIHITDSLGQSHTIVKELSSFVETGKILSW